jgi:hypothetical protein
MPIKKVTPVMLAEIKDALTKFSINETSKQFPVSYYTVWNIAKGNYNNPKPYSRKKELFSCCPITGFRNGHHK